jgi:hypothetical protein
MSPFSPGDPLLNPAPSPRPSPGSSRHRPRLCETAPELRPVAPSRVRIVPHSHTRLPVFSLWRGQPAASLGPGRFAGLSGHRPALELSMVSTLGSLASPTSCGRQGGGRAVRGYPPLRL